MKKVAIYFVSTTRFNKFTNTNSICWKTSSCRFCKNHERVKPNRVNNIDR